MIEEMYVLAKHIDVFTDVQDGARLLHSMAVLNCFDVRLTYLRPPALRGPWADVELAWQWQWQRLSIGIICTANWRSNLQQREYKGLIFPLFAACLGLSVCHVSSLAQPVHCSRTAGTNDCHRLLMNVRETIARARRHASRQAGYRTQLGCR